MMITDEQIAARAFERFLERGGRHGHDVEDWLAAKDDLERAQQRVDVVLVAAGPRVIEVVRSLREFTGRDLREIKYSVDVPHSTVKEAVTRAEADELRRRLEALGAHVELRERARRA
jgi:ribosomal protein L7/L12